MAYERKPLCPITAVVFILILIYIKLNDTPKSFSYNEKNNTPKSFSYNEKNNTPKSFSYNEKPRSEWTILLTVNDGYFDFFQNWYHYYRRLHLNYEVIVIAEDEIVFSKLQQLSEDVLLTLVKSSRNSQSEALLYGSEAFSELTSARPSYILKYLEGGVNVVYTDVDAVWVHNPFPYFNGSFDMWMPSDTPGNLCTGLIAMRSNNETLKLMQNWRDLLKKHPQHDQTAFNKVIQDSHVRLKALDTNLFPSGKRYFHKLSKTNGRNVIIIHNNFMVGHIEKLENFKHSGRWFPRWTAN